jgi:hypothetical protein
VRIEGRRGRNVCSYEKYKENERIKEIGNVENARDSATGCRELQMRMVAVERGGSEGKEQNLGKRAAEEILCRTVGRSFALRHSAYK